MIRKSFLNLKLINHSVKLKKKPHILQYSTPNNFVWMLTPLLLLQTNRSAHFLDYPMSTHTLGHKATGFACKYSRLRGEDSVEDALPPVLMLQQEDILDNGGQAGFREGTIQTSFQERRPFPLQRPLAAHILLNTERERELENSPFNHRHVRQGQIVCFCTLQTRATRDTATLL